MLMQGMHFFLSFSECRCTDGFSGGVSQDSPRVADGSKKLVDDITQRYVGEMRHTCVQGCGVVYVEYAMWLLLFFSV